MNDTERIYHIHRRLQETVTAIPKQRLAAELEVSQRTIARDFDTLRDRLNAPIVYDRKQQGYRYDPEQESFELPGFWFRADETWHPEQAGHWQDGRYHLSVPYANPTELIMEIMKHGSQVEVLDPPELRQAVAQALKEAARQYARD